MNKSKVIGLLLVGLGLAWSCNDAAKIKSKPLNKVYVVGAMKDAMWKGELYPKVLLDTIDNKEGLYGIGPKSYMRGELMIINGKTYQSIIDDKNNLRVEEQYGLSAPFFVYANASVWDTLVLPKTVKTIKSIEHFIATKHHDSFPIVFKLLGKIAKAEIHVQNLPEGTNVSSPKEAHVGQRQFLIENQEVVVIGFYSKTHQGIFTHHDAYSHMHLITKDTKYMGHLDDITIDQMNLLLPKLD
ncbi:acetolactate decarboxylase [Winogradskyella sp. DF17]|uniref:Acetolactate decarboxylase n=1 Tax=Winogradskyella pelagia TaxID=2819984 RepID=A0ABS3T393_9FLAO|nr:acetolactate decarboxylase [Winogradskyella sp. DF17]MBO3117187.1 acetolactate decarboxylase [Winogradskyella sp. DF17]